MSDSNEQFPDYHEEAREYERDDDLYYEKQRELLEQEKKPELSLWDRIKINSELKHELEKKSIDSDDYIHPLERRRGWTAEKNTTKRIKPNTADYYGDKIFAPRDDFCPDQDTEEEEENEKEYEKQNDNPAYNSPEVDLTNRELNIQRRKQKEKEFYISRNIEEFELKKANRAKKDNIVFPLKGGFLKFAMPWDVNKEDDNRYRNYRFSNNLYTKLKTRTKRQMPMLDGLTHSEGTHALLFIDIDKLSNDLMYGFKPTFETMRNKIYQDVGQGSMSHYLLRIKTPSKKIKLAFVVDLNSYKASDLNLRLIVERVIRKAGISYLLTQEVVDLSINGIIKCYFNNSILDRLEYSIDSLPCILAKESDLKIHITKPSFKNRTPINPPTKLVPQPTPLLTVFNIKTTTKKSNTLCHTYRMLKGPIPKYLELLAKEHKINRKLLRVLIESPMLLYFNGFGISMDKASKATEQHKMTVQRALKRLVDKKLLLIVNNTWEWGRRAMRYMASTTLFFALMVYRKSLKAPVKSTEPFSVPTSIEYGEWHKTVWRTSEAFIGRWEEFIEWFESVPYHNSKDRRKHLMTTIQSRLRYSGDPDYHKFDQQAMGD